MQVRWIWAVLFPITALVASAAYGQAITGTISGVARDGSGGVLPGTTITIKNVGTGIVETAVTNAEGRYRVQQLALGDYEVEAQLQGFQTSVRSGIQLTIGREALVTFVLEVGDVTERLVVVGDAPLVTLTSGTISGLVNEETIRELPLNSRDLMQLADLQPGVSVVRHSNPDQDGGFGGQLSVGGARSNQNTYLLDGQTLNDQTNQAPASVSGAVLGVDSVKEFVVLTSAYSAQYGRNAGGVISAVTRSGSNQFSGSVFHFLRHDQFDRANFFDQGRKPDFRRDQFGGTLGGRFVRDKTFFFGSYEGLRQELGETTTSRVPTAEARRGILPSGQVSVNPIMLPYLDLYPLPTPGGRDFGDGLAEYVNVVTTDVTEDYGMVRVDHHWGDGHNTSGRYSRSSAQQTNPHSLGFQSGTLKTTKHFVSLEQRDSFTSNALNTLRFGLNYSPLQHVVTQTTELEPSLLFVPNQSLLGGISVPGMSGIHIENRGETWYKLFELSDNFTYVRGAHTLNVGGHVQRILDDQNRVYFSGGNYGFPSLAEFLRGEASQLTTALPPSDTLRHIRQTFAAAYIQDTWQLTPRFTLDLGLRYEMVTVPLESDGKSANLRDFERDTEVTIGPIWDNPTKLNVAPRLGAAWNVTGDGRTVIRGGFGKFFDEPMAIYYRLALSRVPPFFLSTTATGSVPFPHALPFLTAGSQPRLDTIEYNIKSPYLYQFNVSAEREIYTGGVVSASYVGSRGNNLPVIFSNWNQAVPEVLQDGRLFWASGLPRRNPAFSAIRLRQTIGHSWYDALSVGFRQRGSDLFQLNTTYTLAKMADEGTNMTLTGEAEPTLYEVWDFRRARGLSSLDLRHSFTVSGTVLLPFGRNSTGIAKVLLDGWQFNGILRMLSGQPFSATLGFDRARILAQFGGDGQRPDLAAGASNNPILGDPDRYFDPTAFQLPEAGFLGNLGRNTLIGPGLVTLDLSAAKNISLGATRNLQVRIEAFNLLNRANFRRPNSTIFSAAGRVGSAGQITGTSTSARQVQLGLKFTF